MIDFYTKTCGACNTFVPFLSNLCKTQPVEPSTSWELELGNTVMGRIVYLKHDCYDEYDDFTDIAKLYNVRAFPSFGFFQVTESILCRGSSITSSMRNKNENGEREKIG